MLSFCQKYVLNRIYGDFQGPKFNDYDYEEEDRRGQ
jgi:hypothetical protein